MPHLLLTQIAQTGRWLIAVAAACAACWILWLSRYQPIEWDLAMLHYAAFLINEKGFILYRDIFENNLPGTFLFHVLLGKTIGYDALPMRLVDFTILAGLSLATWKLLSPASGPAGILAPSLFIAVYLYTGTTVALQRDYIGILPIVIAVLVAARQHENRILAICVSGALCGLSCSLKPNYIIVFPLLYGLFMLENPRIPLAEKCRLFFAMGFSFVGIFSIPFIWGLFKADYAELVHIYQTFTPIYVQSRIDLYHFTTPHEQILELVKNQLHHMRNCLIIAGPGLAWGWLQTIPGSPERKLVTRIGIVTIVFSFYELLAGKYWLAHLLPSYYWNALSFSLLLLPPQKTGTLFQRLFAATITAIVAISASFLLFATIQKTADAGYTKSNEHIRSQKIAKYLNENLKPEDTAQGIDGSGDGQGSLLLARARVATRYLEDIPLYMQPEAPATKAFRQEFIEALNSNKPEFIVYIHNIFHPAGGNRLKEFTELSLFISQNYEEAVLDEGEYTIYRRKH